MTTARARLPLGRRFILWHLLRWGSRGPYWHPIVLVVGIAVVVAAVYLGNTRR